VSGVWSVLSSGFIR